MISLRTPKSLLVACILPILLGLVFVFLVSVSRYPAGDDPGFHTSVLRSLLTEERVDFALPYFPQLGQEWGSERFVTKLFLTAVGKVTGVTDVFPLHIIFTALCATLALIPLYLLMTAWTRSRVAGYLLVLFLGFSKFYQENFWEGSYDQYTGLLFVSVFLSALYRWFYEGRRSWLVVSVLLIAGLYKTHELGFLVALTLFLAAALYRTWQRWGWRIGLGAALLVTLVLGSAALLTPVYFQINTNDYPILKIMSSDEGIPLLTLLFAALGFVLTLFRKRASFFIVWLAVAVAWSQSTYIGSPFYAFRFNMFFMQITMVLAVFAIMEVRSALRLQTQWQHAFFFGILFTFALLPQMNYTYGVASWVTSQERNPASVILEDDVAVFRWAGEHTERDAVFLAPFKWGYYLPAVAGRRVVLDEAVGGDSKDSRFALAQQGRSVYETPDATMAHRAARELGVQYIVWDASIARFPDRYTTYDEEKFRNPEFFTLLFERNDARLYKVL